MFSFVFWWKCLAEVVFSPFFHVLINQRRTFGLQDPAGPVETMGWNQANLVGDFSLIKGLVTLPI